MPGEITLSIEDLDKLTAKDLEGVRLIHLLDQEIWTEEHRKKLKELADSRGCDYSLDATALEEKLKNLSSVGARRTSTSPTSVPTTSSPSRSPSPDPELEAIKARRHAANLRDYNYLIETGGRPAFPLEMAYAPASTDFGEYMPMIDYWDQDFLGQRNRWVSFLNFQRKQRMTTEIFAKYKQAVHDHRKKEGIEGNIQLLFDEKQQSKVDRWKEYHYYHHRCLPRKREKAEAARKEREQEVLDWEAGKRAPSIPEDMGWIHHVRSLEESHLGKFMGLVQWIEAELSKIEQECVGDANEVVDDASCVAEKSDKGKQSTTAQSAQAESAPSCAEKQSTSSRRSTGSAKKSTNSLGVIGTPRVSTRKRAKQVGSAKHLRHADLGTATLAPPDQSSIYAGRVAREDMISRSSRKKRSRVRNPATTPPAEMGSLRRSQRIIDMESRKVRQKIVQETAGPSQIVPKTESRRQPRAHQVKRSSKPVPPQSRPQGITKPPALRKGRLPRVGKNNTLPRAVAV